MVQSFKNMNVWQVPKWKFQILTQTWLVNKKESQWQVLQQFTTTNSSVLQPGILGLEFFAYSEVLNWVRSKMLS